jgi:hypothetical protein
MLHRLAERHVGCFEKGRGCQAAAQDSRDEKEPSGSDMTAAIATLGLGFVMGNPNVVSASVPILSCGFSGFLAALQGMAAMTAEKGERHMALRMAIRTGSESPFLICFQVG